ncbi:N-terminal binuclear Zn cluster-containing/DNA binding domain-containing protein [Dactylonectria estremocensis]|uniref:N-terminal binuclear Zn cluster-containing/DNA binding domain-containing protein n=1 Tax=Dactylonectria estremocensis TaxID=1079267 RepID=A0A9P9FLW9_9HYPO|nr:N-terminal binuclear Zn cluster-containing/DNA binding domain-containing protein [Dactylonectria estremocensis]
MRRTDYDGNSANAAKRRRGRTATACIECQRRKKKCDRQWPCNHCQDRRIARLCDFGVKLAQPRGTSSTITPPNQSRPGGGTTSTATTLTTTITAAATNTSSTLGDDSTLLPDASSAVHALGYVNSDMFTSVMSSQQSTDDERTLELPPPVLQATRTLPPRPYTDILVQNFFDKVNYHYGILHQPSFMATYTTWWSRRLERRYSRSISAIAMACLLLRICANSAQFLSSDTKSQLESDLGDSADSISNLYHAAADVLSDFLPAGSGGLVNAQQLFLGATWLKAEAEFAKAWHELASCVRQAQEICIHLDDLPDGMTVFERDLRRRLWCAAYTWDKFMAVTFHRPPIIQAGNSVQLPSQSLDSSPTNPEIPSATAAKTLENQLARHLAETERSSNSYADMMTFTEDWMMSLPPAFRIDKSDTRWDMECPRLAFQRLQLHSVGYMTQLLLLRPKVVSKVDATFDEELRVERSRSIHHAVDVSLKAMAVSKEFFDLCFPQEAKYFMVSFCPFDNAALLCSLLLHDTGRANVPRRLEVAAAIGTALHIAHRLRGLTKMPDVTSSILTLLVSHLNLQPTEKEMLNEAARTGEAHAVGAGSRQIEHLGTDRQPTNSIDFDLSDASIAVGDEFQEIDLGILDGLWDWQSLQLDFVGDNIG